MTADRLLLDLIREARESCAGSSPKEKQVLMSKLAKAIDIAKSTDADVACSHLVERLERAKELIEKSRNFYERLGADRILSTIINEFNVRKQDKTIVIEVFQGVVNDVKNLPYGWNYRVVDLDEEERSLLRVLQDSDEDETDEIAGS